ncbi:MAG: hypothetical protein OXC57_09735 [Rhodobacteraceae bacterium]|nr:hypothetical protein [Paracoccaceae bacterium]
MVTACGKKGWDIDVDDEHIGVMLVRVADGRLGRPCHLVSGHHPSALCRMPTKWRWRFTYQSHPG